MVYRIPIDVAGIKVEININIGGGHVLAPGEKNIK